MAQLAARRTLALVQPRTTARSLFNFPSPFAAAPPPPERKGTLRKEGSAWVYREDKLMPYSPAELCTVIADVDAYQHFLPFTTSSRVLRAAHIDAQGRRAERSLADKGWLTPGDGERWEMDGELRIGAMGFDEGYVSLVEMEKAKWVKATAKDASMFRHLSTLWSFAPAPSSTPSAPQSRVDLYLSYAFTSPLHAAAIQTVWDKISALMVDKFEQRVRDVHGRR
ncbi:hypothetical protein JCM3770_000530 [Rhodotorula araucariae]